MTLIDELFQELQTEVSTGKTDLVTYLDRLKPQLTTHFGKHNTSILLNHLLYKYKEAAHEEKTLDIRRKASLLSLSYLISSRHTRRYDLTHSFDKWLFAAFPNPDTIKQSRPIRLLFRKHFQHRAALTKDAYRSWRNEFIELTQSVDPNDTPIASLEIYTATKKAALTEAYQTQDQRAAISNTPYTARASSQLFITQAIVDAAKQHAKKTEQDYISRLTWRNWLIGQAGIAMTNQPSYQKGIMVGQRLFDATKAFDSDSFLGNDTAGLEDYFIIAFGCIALLLYIIASSVFIGSEFTKHSDAMTRCISQIILNQITVLLAISNFLDPYLQWATDPIIRFATKRYQLTPKTQLNIRSWLRFDDLGYFQKEGLINFMVNFAVHLLLARNKNVMAAGFAYLYCSILTASASQLFTRAFRKKISAGSLNATLMMLQMMLYAESYPDAYRAGQSLFQPFEPERQKALSTLGLHFWSSEKTIKTTCKTARTMAHPDRFAGIQNMTERAAAIDAATDKMQSIGDACEVFDVARKPSKT